jgi:hypothetical protein
MQAPMQNVYAAHPNVLGCPSLVESPVFSRRASSPRTLRTSVSHSSTGARAAELESIAVHELAARGASSAARARAERVVNDYADSEWVREIESFTGAHRHRNVRLNEQGILETF